MTGPALKRFGAQVDQAINKLRPDAVLSISSQPIIASKFIVPTYMLSDAPWMAYKEAYEGYDQLPWLGNIFAEREARAAQKCSGLFFASEWAVDDATRRFGVDRSRVHSVPFGANICPDSSFSTGEVIDRRLANPVLSLLFVGKDWDRKGGTLAVKVAANLAARGVAVILHIVGCEPDAVASLDFIRVHGRLRMSNADEQRRLHQLLVESHFLLVPTQAECFGLVFAEAQAFALPPISRAVHALPTVINDGTSGILIHPDEGAELYVRRIIEIWHDPSRYKAMATNARSAFEKRLNWNAAARSILQMIF